MSVSGVSIIMRRIKSATPHSRIAVFRNKVNGKWVLKAVFASTVQTQQAIRDGATNLVGVYYRGSVQSAVRNTLHRVIK